MPDDSLLRSRRSLAIGTGTTTRRDRVLAAPIILPQIPQRIGQAEVLADYFHELDLRRGFVSAWVSNPPSAKRFDPYTLQILDLAYRLSCAGYSVQTWASGYNVIDALPWHDVACFFDSRIWINAAEMDDLQIPIALLSAPAIPLAIPTGTPGQQWGTLVQNQTEKRVFAIGRWHAQAFDAGQAAISLQPIQPRTDGKALTIGQRLDAAQSKAWLGQLYFTGADWDSAVGGWAFTSEEVSCMLTAPYLQTTSSSATVDLSRATFPQRGTTSSRSVNTAYALPQTAVGLYGIGEVESSGTVYSNLNWSVVWPWRGLFMAARTGVEVGNEATESFPASASAAITCAGRVLSYTCQNDVQFVTRNTSLNCADETIPTGVFANDRGSSSEYTLDNYSDVLTWSNNPGSPPFPDRGQTGFYYFASGIPSSSATTTTTTQTITAAVQRGSEKLVEIIAAVVKTDGQQRSVSAVTPRFFQECLSNPYTNIHSSSGFGIANDVWIHDAPGLPYYKNPSGNWSNMSPAAQAEIQQKFDEMQGGYVGTRCYDYGSAYQPDIYDQYACSLSSFTTTSALLIWRTIDYIFVDETNGVSISVEAEFNGSQTAGTAPATLTVSLRVKTRHHTVTHQLEQRSYSYADLLPDASIPGTQRRAVPSPQVRAIFAPLYQEQGAFKGAAYITAAEEQAGSTPAHLFDFQLRLRTYSAIGTIENLNATTDLVHFIPCNLLEMLYAFVFSQDYGVGRATGQRYPVTDTAKYNNLTSTLFSNVYAVQVRDGVSGSWAGALNGDGAGIFRT